MRKILFSCVLLMTTHLALAQIGTSSFSNQSNVLYNDGNGIPWKSNSDIITDGSPFFDSGYRTGTVKILNGKQYTNLRLKLDLETNTVIFEGQNGQMLAVNRPVERVGLLGVGNKEIVFRSGFNNIDKQNERSLYQVLDSGNVLLLKYVDVKFKDSRSSYGNNDLTRTYKHSSAYYIWTAANGLSKSPTDENSLAAIFPDHKKAIQDFLKKEKTKLKKEEDLMKAISFCNGLVK